MTASPAQATRLAWRRPAALVFAVVAALLVAISLPNILALRFPDPDDVLRLVQVRDLLAGQGWFDLTQHRLDAPGGGVAMHWSRLVDIPLAALILALTPLLGQPLAETVTAVAVPLLTFGCALALVARQAARSCGAATVPFACLALALSVPVLSQVLPLRIDHHGWQVVLALVALAAAMSSDARRGGWVAGVAMAAWLSISLEALPMVAAFCGVLALRWLRDAEKAWFVNAMLGLAGASVLLFAATRGFADLSNYCDMVSPVHLAVLVWGAAGAAVLAKLAPQSRPVLIAGLAAIAGGGAAVLLAVAPACAGGGFAGMDPLVEAFWYRGIAEGQPLWGQPPSGALPALVPPLIGLAGVYALWRSADDARERTRWLDYALLLGAALAVTLFVTRAGAVAGAFAAVPFGWRLQHWLIRLRTAGTPARAGVMIGALVLAMAMVLPGTRYFPLQGDAQPANEVPGAAPPQRANECGVNEAAPLLASLPRGEILAPMDIGPSLLLGSPHTVIASAHHRGENGMRLAIELFLGAPDRAQAALVRRGTAYLALCPGSNEIARFRSASPRGFIARLEDGERFGWLEPLAVPAASNLKVWRIVR